MELAVYSGVSYATYLAVTNTFDIGEVWQELLIAVLIVILNSIILPIVKWLFAKIKTAIKKKQKTPENDGELADILLNGVEQAEDKVEETLTKLSNKGDKNGERSKEK